MTVRGTVIEIEHDHARHTPIALVRLEDQQKTYFLVTEGIGVGDAIAWGSEAEFRNGNSLPLGQIPTGAYVCNIEARPNDGGKFVRRASGDRGRQDRGQVGIRSVGKDEWFSSPPATVGIVAGGGAARSRSSRPARVPQTRGGPNWPRPQCRDEQITTRWWRWPPAPGTAEDGRPRHLAGPEGQALQRSSRRNGDRIWQQRTQKRMPRRRGTLQLPHRGLTGDVVTIPPGHALAGAAQGAPASPGRELPRLGTATPYPDAPPMVVFHMVRRDRDLHGQEFQKVELARVGLPLPRRVRTDEKAGLARVGRYRRHAVEQVRPPEVIAMARTGYSMGITGEQFARVKANELPCSPKHAI
jgi:hypothetical protein